MNTVLRNARELDRINAHLDALESLLTDDAFPHYWLAIWRTRDIAADPTVTLMALATHLRELAELAAIRASDLAVDAAVPA